MFTFREQGHLVDKCLTATGRREAEGV